MAIKYFPTKLSAREIYPDLCRDEQKQLPKINNHIYYGKIEQGGCWKAARLIQIVGAISLAVLTGCLLFVSKEFRNFLDGRIKEIKDPYKYIYIQEQFQKNLPAQAPNLDKVEEDQKQEPEKQKAKEEKNIVEILDEKVEKKLPAIDLHEAEIEQKNLPLIKPKEIPTVEIKEENPPVQFAKENQEPPQELNLEEEKLPIPELPKIEEQPKLIKPLTLQERFNQIVQFFQDDKIDEENNVEKFCLSLNNDEVVKVFELCEKIEPLKNKENFIEAFVKAITFDQLSYCLNRSPKEMRIYKTICGMVVYACHNKDEMCNKKFNLAVADLSKKSYDINYQIYAPHFSEIYDHVFSNCQSIDQLILIMFYNHDQLATKVLKDIPLQVIFKKGWMNKYVQLVSTEIIIKFLEQCNDPKIYFALKNEMMNHGKYTKYFLNSLNDATKVKIENCTQNEFKDPLTQPVDVKISTQIVDENGQLLEVFIYDAKRTKDTVPVYELKTKNDLKLGEIVLRPRLVSLEVSHIECSFDKESPMRLPILKALHEFAIRESFRHNFKGIVRLSDKCQDTAENFFFGYRYRDKEKMEASCLLYGKLKKLIEEYLNAKKAQLPVEDLLVKVENFEKGISIHKDYDKWVIFQEIKMCARRVLGRDGKDMQEVLDHGLYYDKNAYLKKIVENDPFFHPELKKLFASYFASEDPGILQKIDIPQYADQLQRIYEEMRVENFRPQNPDSIEKLASYVYERTSNPIKLKGDMYLSEEKIEELKKEYQLQ